MALDVQIYGKNMDVTDRLQDYIDKRVSRLNRYMNGVDEARVDLAYVKSARNAADRQVAQITLRGKGFIMRSEERSDDMFASIDTAIDKIQRQLERYKGRRQRGRGDGRSAAEVAPEPVVEEGATGPAIVRRKRFLLTPMDEYEAVEQMNLLGHESFFLFHNINTNEINVIYKRRDGNYGLIEPETR